MSAASKKRRYWGFVNPMPAPLLGMIAKGAEAQGLTGLFAPQVYGLLGRCQRFFRSAESFEIPADRTQDCGKLGQVGTSFSCPQLTIEEEGFAARRQRLLGLA